MIIRMHWKSQSVLLTDRCKQCLYATQESHIFYSEVTTFREAFVYLTDEQVGVEKCKHNRFKESKSNIHD